MHQFKIGDIVVRDDPGPGRFPFVGEKCNVIDIRYNFGVPQIKVENNDLWWYSQYFQLVEQPQVKEKEMNKFKIGDKVRISAELSADWIHCVEGMVRFAGTEHTIVRLSALGDGAVYIDGDGGKYYWCEKWLTAVKAGPQRDAKGRFIKQAAPKKEKPKAKEKAVAGPVEIIRAKLTKQVNAHGVGMCSYAIQYADGTTRYQRADICHARLKAQAGWGALNSPAVFACLNVSGYLKEGAQYYVKDAVAYKSFIGWMLKESPWATSFITKDVNEAFEKGILLDVSKPLSQVTCAAIAIRGYSEFKNAVQVYERLIKDGVPKAIAWVLALMTRVDDGVYKVHGDGNHTVVCREMDHAHLKQFINTGFHRNMDEKPFSTNAGDYSIFESIARVRNGDTVTTKMKELGFVMPPYNGAPQLTYFQLLRLANTFV